MTTRHPDISTTEVNETRHRARLNQKQLEALVAEAVAKAAGVTLDGRAVRVEQCYIGNEDSMSTGPQRYAECTIVVDHRPQPAEG